jgi:uncharacterized 2Fe-2S/4Fe-4S cluster protein (DUF4445 family)
MNADLIEIEGDGSSGGSLTDLLAERGHPLNARCGQRGLCRGCMVDLVEGALLDASGETVAAGASVRSCQMRLPEHGRVVLRLHRQARISRAPQVGETFSIDVPYEFCPAIAAMPGKDTAFAVDVGTTTVVVLLADLVTGEVLARAGDFSAQIRYGDNVITRIGAASSPATRREMRRALVEETLAPLLQKACKRAGRDVSRLAGGTIAGNTTMLHILADEDPTSLGIAPFTARFLEGRMLQSGGIGLAPGMPLQLLPGLSAYIGADITAGVHATGMTLDDAPSLLVDMGTNGEVVLCADGRLVGCATAAGPAFEGAGLSSGTRAQDGAVSGIHLEMDPFFLDVETIGGKEAQAGICGSAYIDFLSMARACGLVMENGRFDRGKWAGIPAKHRLETDDGFSFLLAGNDGPGISEIDIAHLLQAKAAIGAGIEILLSTAGITAGEIGRVYLAGGFGMHVDVSHAITIGLLPGFRPDQVRVVGNTALAGALLALLDRGALAEMEALRGRIEVIELNLQPGFEDCFIDHLSLP